MITIKLGSASGGRGEFQVAPSTTIRAFLEEQSVPYESQSVSKDGVMLRAEDFDKTFADLGVTEKCFISSIQKQMAA